MSDTEAPMRPAAPQRPPYPNVMPPRPMAVPPRQSGPMQQSASNFTANQMRPMPPPLRRVDSKGNMVLGPGQGPRPAGPQAPNPIMRPSNSGSSTPMSPINQSGQRPQSQYPWGQALINRAANPYSGNPAVRPPFARPPGAPTGQPHFNRPPFQQQMQQQQQQQQLQQQLQQSPQQVQRQPSAGSVRSNSNEDDDDVVMGQAVTPLKSLNLRTDPIGLKTQEAALFGEPTDIFADAAIPPRSIAQNDKIRGNNLYSEPSTELNESMRSSAKAINSQETRDFQSDIARKITSQTVHKGDNDSGVDESTQEKERNGLGSPNSPAKTPTSTTSSKPEKDKTGASRPPSATPSNKSTKSRSTSRNRLLLKTPEPEPVKKVPMNKIQVGHAPSPNLKAVRSKIGSLDNATYKPGGGHVKIETKKLDIKAAPKIEAKNEKYTPRGGDKKIVSTKLQWNAKSKIGSLENTSHKPGGGDKKIETIKTEFKDKAKPKVGSKDNVKHVPGGGDIKIQTQKLEIKAHSKVGSLDNVKHKPGGGEKKIFDDKDYLKNVEHSVALASPPSQSPPPASMTTSPSGADENLNQQQS